jgi:hypothetical protein
MATRKRVVISVIQYTYADSHVANSRLLLRIGRGRCIGQSAPCDGAEHGLLI